jgi:hypothetical protein
MSAPGHNQAEEIEHFITPLPLRTSLLGISSLRDAEKIGHTSPAIAEGTPAHEKHDHDKTSSEAGTAQRFAGKPYL